MADNEIHDKDVLLNQVLTGQRGRYTLMRLLGEGRTARVYIADAVEAGREPYRVAVKVMRPGLSSVEQAFFNAEAINLNALKGYGAGAAPEYYEDFDTGMVEGPRALVLEMMTSRQVVTLLQEQGPLDEQEGLALGLQLAELLQTLHEKLVRTYTDLKFENLWWQAETKLLKVTDWNVLSDPGQLERIPTDLLRASRYLYTILTGGEVREEGGIVRTPFMRHPGWGALSLGTQGVLRRALHRNPAKRFQTAGDLAHGVRRVQRFWQEDAGRLLIEIERMVGDKYQRVNYERAQELLDVLGRRRDLSAAETERHLVLSERVAQGLGREQTLLERGKHLFRGNSFEEAVTFFSQAVEENPWDLAGWRWREAARAGTVTSGYDRFKQEVELGLDALNASGDETARAEQILAQVPVAALAGLLAETQARRWLVQAERLAGQGQQWIEVGQGDSPEADAALRGAQEAFGQAADSLNRIVPADYLGQVRDELGDPAQRGRALVDERRSLAATAGRALRAAVEAQVRQDWVQVRAALIEGLEAVPTDARLQEVAVQAGEACLASGDASVASSFFGLASGYDPRQGVVRAKWRLASLAAEAVDLLGQNRWASGMDRAAEALAQPADPETRSSVVSVLMKAVSDALKQPAVAGNLPALRRMVDQTQRFAEIDPRLARWAQQRDWQWPELAARWLKAKAPEWDAGELADQIETALTFTPGPQWTDLAHELMPLVRERVQQGVGWWRTPGIQRLMDAVADLQKALPDKERDRAFVADEYCRLIEADITATVSTNQELALQRAQAALDTAPESMRPRLAQRLQDTLSAILKQLPAEINPDGAELVLKVVEPVAALPDFKDTSWAAEVAAYRGSLAAERDRRRNAAWEAVNQRVQALRSGGDQDALTQARLVVEEALVLTPEDLPQRKRLEALKDQLVNDLAQGEDALKTIRRSLDAFPGALGAARDDDDFAAIERSLSEARDLAEKANELELLKACNEKLRVVRKVRESQPAAAQLLKKLDDIKSEITELNKLTRIPGISTALDNRWREMDAMAQALLALHPGYTEAQKVQSEVDKYMHQVGLADRVTQLRQLRDEIGQPLNDLEYARAAWMAGDLGAAQQTTAALPAVWQQLPDVYDLKERMSGTASYLDHARELAQARDLDTEFETRLRSVLALAETIPAPYVAQAGIADGLKKRRDGLLATVSVKKGPADRVADGLAKLVAADQFWRLAARPTMPSPGPTYDANAFVAEALAPTSGRDADQASRLDKLLQGLPSADQPLQLAQEVRTAAIQQFSDRAAAERATWQRRLAPVGLGALLLLALAALAGLVWPGFLPGSRAEYARRLVTATAEAARPRVTVVTRVVPGTPVPPQVIEVTRVVTVVVTLPATATSTLEPTVTPSPTPALPWFDAARAERVARGTLGVAPGLQGPSPVTAQDIVAVLDDADPGAGPFSDGQAVPLQQIAEFGEFGGMHYASVPATAPTSPIFVWPVMTLEPGAYRLFVHLPKDHGTVRVTYQVVDLVNRGQSIPIGGQPGVAVDQFSYENKWVYIGDMTLETATTLQIQALAQRGAARKKYEVGFDAVAIVRIP